MLALSKSCTSGVVLSANRFLKNNHDQSAPKAADAEQSLASQTKACVVDTSIIFEATSDTGSESVVESANAILIGPASVVAAFEFAVIVNVGFITPILNRFILYVRYTQDNHMVK